MRRIISAMIITLVVVASGLYAGEGDTSQREPGIKLELIWEAEIPEGVQKVVFLDEKGYNVFSVQCEDPEGALRDKRVLMVEGGRLRYCEGEGMRLVREVELRGGHIAISKNGRNIVTIEGLERDTMKEGGYIDKPAVLRLYRWDGEELGEVEISPGGWEYIDLYPLGNDRTVLMHLAGGEGLYNGIEVLVRHGERLEEEITDLESSWVVDYAESGERALVVLRNRYMVVIDGEGREESRYICPRPFRGGYLSPRGNYIAEVTAGKYVMIYDRGGRLIAEHHVQGPGNYYAAFSPDEKYLCVTPGFRKIYFFETQTGKLIWEYTYPDDRPSFFPGDVAPEGEFTFMVFTPSKEESKWIRVFDKGGKVVGKLGPLDFSGYSLPVRYVGQVQQLFVRLPSRMFLYRLDGIGGE
ncbi:MAG: hypothetical protein J7K11_03355 [Candidatus Hydrothermae bacterium]|nr:hypothetical protein [Candidatus Hydrothermae bacterium]